MLLKILNICKEKIKNIGMSPLYVGMGLFVGSRNAGDIKPIFEFLIFFVLIQLIFTRSYEITFEISKKDENTKSV